MQEEERNRYKILIDRGNEVFERLDGHISSLNNRAIALLSLNLVFITLILTVLLYLLDRGWQPSANEQYVLIFTIGLLVFSVGISLHIFKPTRYNEINVFEEERFNELKGMNEKRLLSNNLADIRAAYEFNLEKYKKRTTWFILSYICHMGAFGILIIALIINL
jgi:hypothetical protein